jgi:nucleotide-binding universal stress UspA family protein
METILVVVDESGVAERAVSMAADLAAGLGARLVAVSVVDGLTASVNVVRAVQRRVQSLGRELGIDVDVVTLHGHPVDEVVVQKARAVGADLVVVAGSGDQPDGVGETAGRLLHTWRLPVLVVPQEV